jgi:hypothetical protein
MKKFIIILAGILFLLCPVLKADEGMWIPMLLNDQVYQQMKVLGLKLSADQIYSINHSSLKDAVIQFGRGCTGEIISPQGLIITNHHCGYGAIQSNSSVEHDLLTDGFWAMSMKEELPNPGLTASFLVYIEDVSSKVLVQLSDTMSEESRGKKIGEINAEIVKNATKDTKYDAIVRSFFGGNEFYLLVYVTYKDVRLVGAPPSAIGKFGGDTDNWMWPRHTGDFSMFRVYTGPDGSPAEYSENNIPYKPKYWLPISMRGYNLGDFAMILGYPGATDRYLTSYGVNLAISKTSPAIVKIRTEKLNIMDHDMAASNEVRIKYATKYSRISNYWKYYIGQTKNLKRLKVFDQKIGIEKDFTQWVNSDPARTARYGNVLSNIGNAYKTISEYAIPLTYYREAGRGPEIFSFASRFNDLYKALQAEPRDQSQIDKMVSSLKEYSVSYFKDYNIPTDQKMLASMMKLYSEDVPAKYQPEYLMSIAGKYKSDFKNYAAYVFEKSIFATKEKVDAFLAKPNAKLIGKDPAFVAAQAFAARNSEFQDKTKAAYAQLSRNNRLFVEGLRAMNPGKKFYPDANGTMRLTYGTIQDYYPADGTHYGYYTTLDGVMEKEDPANPEFIVPEKLKELWKNKDYGKYADAGNLHVCFLTTNDITGGNSGSPVINAYGELLGLAFDGNWEAMSGDIAYERKYQRTICVDIRYILFIIDKYAGAQNIINELTLNSSVPEVNTTMQTVPVPARAEPVTR